MPDEPTPAAVATAQVAPTEQPPTAPPDDLGEKGEKALEAWKQRAKAAEADAKKARALEAQLQQIEDRDKSEKQKLADRATAAEKAAAEASQKYLRLKVGAAKGLTPDLAERLQGDTEDDLAADADSLLKALKPQSTGNFDAGARSSSAPAGADMNVLIRRAAGRA